MSEKPTAFVLMPFKSEMNWVFEHIISPAITDAGYEPVRADSGFDQRAVMHDIVTGIVGAGIVVADLTESNPNVMYELGIAHALGIPAFMMTQTMPDTPFDIRAYRTHRYSAAPESVAETRIALAEVARRRLDGNAKFSNPVADYLPRTSSILHGVASQPFSAIAAERIYAKPEDDLVPRTELLDAPLTWQRIQADYSAAIRRVEAWNELINETSEGPGSVATERINDVAKLESIPSRSVDRIAAEAVAVAAVKEWTDQFEQANRMLLESAEAMSEVADDVANVVGLPPDANSEDIPALVVELRTSAAKARSIGSDVANAGESFMAPSNATKNLRRALATLASKHLDTDRYINEFSAATERFASILEDRV